LEHPLFSLRLPVLETNAVHRSAGVLERRGLARLSPKNAANKFAG
jgi:hypothetical protein